MKKRISLVPAYGRDYRSKAAVEEAFKADADFRIEDMSEPDDGRYVNRPQLLGKYEEANIRYKRLTQVAVVRVR